MPSVLVFSLGLGGAKGLDRTPRNSDGEACAKKTLYTLYRSDIAQLSTRFKRTNIVNYVNNVIILAKLML